MSNTIQNTPSVEVINLISTEMTDAATLKLINVVKELEQYYGLEVTEMVSIIDDFINHFHTNEMIKTEIKEEINYYRKSYKVSHVDNLLNDISDKCVTYDSEAQALNHDLFALRMCKKFISDIALVFALNQPVRDRKIEEVTKNN